MNTNQLAVQSPQEKEQWLTRASIAYDKNRDMLIEELSNEDMGLKKTVNVSGFEVSFSDEESSEALKLSLLQEIENASIVRKTLRTAGIAPIAILPSGIFRTLITEAKLYSFYRMKDTGEVYGNGAAFQEKYSFSNNNVVLTLFLIVAHLVCLCFLGALLGIGNHLYFISFAALQLIIGVVGGLNSENPENAKTYERAVFCYLCTAPLFALIRYAYKSALKRNIAKHLWPKYTDNDKDIDECEDLFKIILPTPPLSIQEKLLRCYRAGLKTFLVADRRAFSVVLDNETLGILKQKYPTDPIIAYESYGMVAVIDQFGDFAGEKKVMQYIAEHFDAKRADLLPLQQN
ncbi:MAG TPA: hypothetical protein VGE18_01820 [Candidatus Paceibacterota bacterium]